MIKKSLCEGLVDIGRKIKMIRGELGLAQTKFAKPLGIGGPYVADIENGKKQPSNTLMALVVAHYGVSRDWWETGEGEMFSPTGGTETAGQLVVEIFD